MAYRTIDRVASGIVFFGPTPADQTFESSSSFRIDTSNSRLITPNITINDGGKIGSASQTGILTLGSDGLATFSSGVVINGNLTINGTTTTVNTETLTVDDNIIVLNNNYAGSTPSENAGIEVERGTQTNVQFIWDETSDYWSFSNTAGTYFEIASRTGTQTLLNKTIDGASNTLTNIGNASLVNSSVTITAGNGLINGGSVSLGGSVTLNVGAGNGISVAADAVAVTDGSGILVDANGVHANLISYATQSVAANAASSTASRTYPIQVNGSDQLVVNVPWTDTGMTFSITDGTTSQTISNSDTLRFQSGAAINFTVSATDTVSGTLNAAVAGVGLSMTNQVLAIDISEYGSGVAVASGDSFLMLDSDGSTEQLSTVSQLGTYLAGTGIVSDGAGVLSVNTDNSTLEVNADIVRIKDNGVTDAKLRQSAGLSVIGRSANTTGNVADITSGTDGHVLRQSGTSIGFGTVATAGIANGAVTEVKRSRTVAAVSTTSTLSSDINLCTAGAGGITVTLPAVATGLMIIIKKVDTGAGNVIIQRGGSALIDGATTTQLYYQYESMTLVSNGTDWFVI